MAAIIELTNHEWSLVEDLFDPAGRRGIPARYPRRSMVEAILFLARTGCQWRYLPDHYPPWAAVWQQWRRWRASGVWARAMSRITRLIRSRRRAHIEPTMVMIDAQTVRGGRAGPTFHSVGGRGGRTIGTKRSILIEILGLPLAVRVDPAKPHDVRVGRELIADHLAELPDVRAIVADRGYRGLASLAARKHLSATTSRRRPRERAVSPRSRRSTGSSTRSLGWGAGDGCRAATKEPKPARRRGSRSSAWRICS